MPSFLFKPDRPGEDPIFALHQEAMQRIARGDSIVNATIGVLLDDTGKLAVLPTAARAVRELTEEEWAPYAPIAGTAPFLEAVADDLLAKHSALRSSAVAIATPGGSGALRHAIATFLEPGQALLTSSFYWGPYAILADENHRHVQTYEMFDATSGESQLNIPALDRALGQIVAAQGRALVLINDPCQNPTGYSMDERDWRAVAESIARHADRAPITVLLDSAYMVYGANGIETALSAMEPLLGRALFLIAWTASKSFTFYGMRVGALVALVPDADERRRMQGAFGYASRGSWSNCNRGGMTAVARILRDPAMKAQIGRERSDLVRLLGARVAKFNELARAAGLRYPRYDGGFFVTVFADDGFAAAERAKADGVFVVPHKGAVRIALSSVPVADVPRVVDALARACN